MNILITSAGRRVKIVEYFKSTFEGSRVIATDCDINAPAIHFAHGFEIVPRIDHPEYIEVILNICKKHDIKAIISLIDPELELLAKNKSKFKNEGIQLILSPIKMIEMSFNKYDTYDYLNEQSIQTVPTYMCLNEVITLLDDNKLKFPLVVKPAKGSASIGLFIVENREQLIEAYYKFENQIIQPFYKDKEFGIDVYIDMLSGELVDLFIKEKLRMRAGETDKSVSVHNNKIEELIKNTINKTDFKGPVDIDCFEYKGEYYVSEINPRFGGGYPHAYEMGCDFIKYIHQNLNGNTNQLYDGYKYEADVVMMKYDRIKIMKKKFK